MPGMNGFEVAQHIRGASWGREIVLIALTGWGQVEDKRRSKEAGFDHHLVKPPAFAEISRILAGVQAVEDAGVPH